MNINNLQNNRKMTLDGATILGNSKEHCTSDRDIEREQVKTDHGCHQRIHAVSVILIDTGNWRLSVNYPIATSGVLSLEISLQRRQLHLGLRGSQISLIVYSLALFCYTGRYNDMITM